MNTASKSDTDLESIADAYYHTCDRLTEWGHSLVHLVVAPADAEGLPDWERADPTTLVNPSSDSDPADIDEVRRWCLLVEEIEACDTGTLMLVWLDETGTPQFRQIDGPASDGEIAARIIARDMATAPPPIVHDAMSEKLAALASRFEARHDAPPIAANDNEPQRLTSFNARDLMSMEFEPVRYVVPGFFAEGCTILVGAPKLGKSWLVLQTAMAIARGSTCLGGECLQGDVLYLALEDNARRLQDRLRKQNPTASELPACLQFETEWPTADRGGIASVEAWLKAHPDAKMVIIDVLKRFRASRKGNKNAYDLDYDDIRPLTRLAGIYKVAVVIVHHTNKGAATADPLDRVSGTGGISGAADATLTLERDEAGRVKLYGRGRDIEEIETVVTFDKSTCTWQTEGAPDSIVSQTAAKILAAMQEHGEPMGPTAIAAASGVKSGDVNQHLPRLAKAGKIRKEARGMWTFAG